MNVTDVLARDRDSKDMQNIQVEDIEDGSEILSSQQQNELQSEFIQNQSEVLPSQSQENRVNLNYLNPESNYSQDSANGQQFKQPESPFMQGTQSQEQEEEPNVSLQPIIQNQEEVQKSNNHFYKKFVKSNSQEAENEQPQSNFKQQLDQHLPEIQQSDQEKQNNSVPNSALDNFPEGQLQKQHPTESLIESGTILQLSKVEQLHKEISQEEESKQEITKKQIQEIPLNQEFQNDSGEIPSQVKSEPSKQFDQKIEELPQQKSKEEKQKQEIQPEKIVESQPKQLPESGTNQKVEKQGSLIEKIEEVNQRFEQQNKEAQKNMGSESPQVNSTEVNSQFLQKVESLPESNLPLEEQKQEVPAIKLTKEKDEKQIPQNQQVKQNLPIKESEKQINAEEIQNLSNSNSHSQLEQSPQQHQIEQKFESRDAENFLNQIENSQKADGQQADKIELEQWEARLKEREACLQKKEDQLMERNEEILKCKANAEKLREFLSNFDYSQMIEQNKMPENFEAALDDLQFEDREFARSLLQKINYSFELIELSYNATNLPIDNHSSLTIYISENLLKSHFKQQLADHFVKLKNYLRDSQSLTIQMFANLLNLQQKELREEQILQLQKRLADTKEKVLELEKNEAKQILVTLDHLLDQSTHVQEFIKENQKEHFNNIKTQIREQQQYINRNRPL